MSKTLDLAQALGEELDDGGGYVLWPKLIRQIMAASVLVRTVQGSFFVFIPDARTRGTNDEKQMLVLCSRKAFSWTIWDVPHLTGSGAKTDRGGVVFRATTLRWLIVEPI